MVSKVNYRLRDLKVIYKSYEEKILDVIDSLLIEMNVKFAALDLSEDQGRMFCELVESAMAQSLEAYTSYILHPTLSWMYLLKV